jgi:hypothetical protein
MSKSQTPTVADRKAEAAQIDGFRYAFVARSTGTFVICVKDSEYDGSSDHGYSLICDDHGIAASFESFSVVRTWSPQPEAWCSSCARQARKSA